MIPILKASLNFAIPIVAATITVHYTLKVVKAYDRWLASLTK